MRSYYLDFYSACGIFAALSFVLVIVLWVVCEVRRGHIVAPEYTDDDMLHSKVGLFIFHFKTSRFCLCVYANHLERGFVYKRLA